MAERNGADIIRLRPEEKIACRILKKFKLKPGFDIEVFAKKFTSLQEISIPFKIDALFLNSDSNKKPEIILNSRNYHRRKRFTLAHELGHYFIPWHAGMIVCYIDSAPDYLKFLHKEMESEANHFAAELILPSSWVLDLIKQYDSSVNIIEKLIATGASYTAANIKLINALPSGYVFVQVSNYREQVLCSGKSINTPIYPPMEGDDFDATLYKDICSKHEIIQNDLITIHWFEFKKEQRKVSSKTDLRDSKQILRNFLEKTILVEDLRMKLMRRINGIIGAANTRKTITNEDDMVNHLYLKFGSDDELSQLLKQREFKLFITRKSDELIKKRVPRK